jgi:hypothetical protein
VFFRHIHIFAFNFGMSLSVVGFRHH